MIWPWHPKQMQLAENSQNLRMKNWCSNLYQEFFLIQSKKSETCICLLHNSGFQHPLQLAHICFWNKVIKSVKYMYIPLLMKWLLIFSLITDSTLQYTCSCHIYISFRRYVGKTLHFMTGPSTIVRHKLRQTMNKQSWARH